MEKVKRGQVVFEADPFPSSTPTFTSWREFSQPTLRHIPPKRDCMRNGTLLDQTYFLNFTSGFGFGIILGQNCYDKVQNDGLTRQGKQAKNTRIRSRLQLLILQSGSGLERLLHFQVQSCLSFMWPLRPGTFKLKPEMVCRFYASGNALPLKLKWEMSAMWMFKNAKQITRKSSWITIEMSDYQRNECRYAPWGICLNSDNPPPRVSIQHSSSFSVT